MNLRILSLCILTGSMLAPIAARAADGDTDRAHPVTFVKDSVITTKVKTKLAADKMRTLTHVSVDTDRDGMVYLSGSVKNRESLDQAVAIARDTEGVTSVKNDIKIVADK